MEGEEGERERRGGGMVSSSVNKKVGRERRREGARGGRDEWIEKGERGGG